MQDLGSVQNLDFHSPVLGFPIVLSPRTMQNLGSVQNLDFQSHVLGLPIGLSSKTMQDLGSVQNLDCHVVWGMLAHRPRCGTLVWED